MTTTVNSPAEYLAICEEPDETIDFWRLSASEEVWRAIIEEYPELRQNVAGTKTIPDSIIRILARDPDWRVRSRIASKRKAPADVLEALSRDVDEAVRSSVAANPKVTREILEGLADDEWEDIREIVARRLAKLPAP